MQTFVFDKVKYKSCCLLEPSFGAGHLLKKFKDYDPDYPMVCYELDTSIPPVVNFNDHQHVVYGDFTTQPISKSFKTIIGNPPYVKQKNGNLYIKFIELCYNYLDEDGEMIFIVPSDFIKLTCASSLIEKMTSTGTFTDFLFPNNEKLFEGASIDVMVFRYQKSIFNNTTNVNGQQMFCNVTKGIITFSHTELECMYVGNEFDVYVGMVSGKDEVYKVPFGNIDVLVDKDRTEKFIFIDKYPSMNQEIDDHLKNHKDILMSRKIKTFTDKNWFEWGAPRNISSIRKYWGRDCIYIRTITRKKEVAFMGTVQFFGGSLLCIIPKRDMSHEMLQSVIDYMNSDTFQQKYMYAGRFKIGHKHIKMAHIPNFIPN